MASGGLIGYATADTIAGGPGNHTTQGRGGPDTLSGGHGNDILDDGAGNDSLRGENGADTCRFGRGSGKDSITHPCMPGRNRTVGRIA